MNSSRAPNMARILRIARPAVLLDPPALPTQRRLFQTRNAGGQPPAAARHRHATPLVRASFVGGQARGLVLGDQDVGMTIARDIDEAKIAIVEIDVRE